MSGPNLTEVDYDSGISPGFSKSTAAGSKGHVEATYAKGVTDLGTAGRAKEWREGQ